jgi:hypothetical protein
VKLRVNFQLKKLSINETVEGADATQVLRRAKLATASKMNVLVGGLVRSMADMEFAREVVRRYNAAVGAACPMPTTPEEFIRWAVSEKLATALDE